MPSNQEKVSQLLDTIRSGRNSKTAAKKSASGARSIGKKFSSQ